MIGVRTTLPVSVDLANAEDRGVYVCAVVSRGAAVVGNDAVMTGECQVVGTAGCALAEHQCQQSAEHDAAEKQRPIRGLQGKKPSFAHNVRKHRQTRC